MALSSPETIGRCDLCGLIDHHLIDGECPACRRGPIAAAVRMDALAATRMTSEQISDTRLDLLGSRYQAQCIGQLLSISFEQYIEKPECFDRIAAHLESGGGCRVDQGRWIINQEVNHA